MVGEQKRKIDFEAMLAYLLSWYILPSDPNDGLNTYVFPLTIRLGRGDRLALGPNLRSLFYRLEECVYHITRSFGRYVAVTCVDTSFLQLLLWERFKTVGPKPAEFASN